MKASQVLIFQFNDHFPTCWITNVWRKTTWVQFSGIAYC